MIKLVFFDVGGTLIRPEPSVGAIYSRIALLHGVRTDANDIDTRFKLVWKEKKKDRESIDENWWKKVVGEVFKGHTFADSGKFFQDLYRAFEAPSAWALYSDVQTTLQTLSQRGIRLAVVSNWDDRLPKLLVDLNLAPYFERQFISCQTGLIKPDPAVFHHAIKEMDVDALETMHVGDDPEEDILCAEAAGIRAYLIDRKSRPLNSRMLSSLDELLLRT